MKIKTFEDTNIDIYVDYITECGFDCYVKNGYILVGDRRDNFSINKTLLGQKLKNKRKKIKMSREKMSKITGICESSLFYIEHGMIPVKDDKLYKICEVLGLNKDQLLEECREGC